MPESDQLRQRGRRDGRDLRAEIVSAARSLLEEVGVESAVTLRGVARRVGVTAPALYGHFPDQAALLDAALEEEFVDLGVALATAMGAHVDPVARLRAGARAYVAHAHAHPAAYRVLFTRHQPSELQAVGGRAAETFAGFVGTVRECVAAGRSGSTDPHDDAVALWAAVHGLASLPPAHPRFPWPDLEGLIDTTMDRLLMIDVSPQS